MNRGDGLRGPRRGVPPPRRESWSPRPPRPDAGPSNDDLVYGLHPVETFLAEAPARIREIWIDASSGPGPRKVADDARAAGVTVRVLPAEAFRDLARGRPFQGVAARVKPFEYADGDDLAEACRARPGAVLVALDSVQDPHNLGSILRSAAFFEIGRAHV